MTPDRIIVKKVRRYDPNLYIRWNSERRYFELWLKRLFKEPALITTITKSIYDPMAKQEFVELDERLLWWIADADSWKDGIKEHGLKGDKRWLEFQENMDKNKVRDYRDMAKDMWQDANAFYTTRYKGKNKASFNTHKQHNQKWVRPDGRKRNTSSRTFYRTGGNAKAYNYGGGR